MVILITNDDEIQARGIQALHRELAKRWQTVVVAPDRERSATSHSMTLNRSLKICKVEEDMYSIDGTPTDCVMYAVYSLLPQKPDLVVSGINHGANLADDVTYSGTVAAAIEGTLLGIPSVALSVQRKGNPGFDHSGIFEYAAGFSVRLIDTICREVMPPNTLLNVNIPNCEQKDIGATRITRLGKRLYQDVIERKKDELGQFSFRIAGSVANWEGGEDSDVHAIEHNMISITPIHLELTNYDAIEKLKRWKLEE